MSLYLTRISIAFAAVLCVVSGAANAAEHVVKMLNDNGEGQYMVFEPDYIEAAPGDTVRFVAVDEFHNAETMPEIWPEGASRLQGELSKDVTFTIEKPGVYGIKCLPHYPMGMIALVVAGEPVNKDQLAGYEPPAMAKERFDALAAKVQ